VSGELDEFIDEWGFFVAVPELVIKAWTAIGTDAVAAFLYLRYRTNRERGIAFPSFDDMQAGMGWRRERIASALRSLEEHGFLKRRKKVGQVTTYRLVKPLPVAGIRSPDGGLREDGRSPDAEPSQSAIRTSVVRQGDAIQDSSTQDSSTQKGKVPPRPSAGRPPEAHPAVRIFREETQRYPKKATQPEIENLVGRDPDELALWRRVVHEWVALGWNPMNVRGMLGFFSRQEIPTTRGGKATEPKGFQAVRQAMAEAGHGE